MHLLLATRQRAFLKAFLREEGGPLAVEGARVTFNLRGFYCNALSLSLLLRKIQLPPGETLIKSWKNEKIKKNCNFLVFITQLAIVICFILPLMGDIFPNWA